MSFLEFYDNVRESREDFYVGKILVHLVEVSEATFLAEAANNTIANPKSLQKDPSNPDSVGSLPDPAGTKKWRATYHINGREITNYLTAQNKNEAKRMLFDYLNVGSDKDKVHIVRSSEFAPVNNWNELVRLLQYSMAHDRRKKGSDTEPFGSLDNADFHLMLTLVQKHPDFVQRHLAALPQDVQFYFKKAYNALSKRDLSQDLSKGTGGSYWGNQVKGLVDEFGKNISKRLAAVKTRHSPTAAAPAPEPVAPIPSQEFRPTLPEPVPPQQGSLGMGDEIPDYEERPHRLTGMPPQRTMPQFQSRLPFWRSM